MEQKIRTISKQIEIECKRCGYEGSATAIRLYYVDCPECNEMVYVGHLTQSTDK